MSWLSRLFQPRPPPEISYSAKQYPWKLLENDKIKYKLSPLKSLRFNRQGDDFTLIGKRDEYRIAAKILIIAKLKLLGGLPID